MENKKLKLKIFEKFDSYQKFAYQADVSEKTIIDIVKQRRKPHTKTVINIVNALDIEHPDEVNLEY